MSGMVTMTGHAVRPQKNVLLDRETVTVMLIVKQGLSVEKTTASHLSVGQILQQIAASNLQVILK